MGEKKKKEFIEKHKTYRVVSSFLFFLSLNPNRNPKPQNHTAWPEMWSLFREQQFTIGLGSASCLHGIAHTDKRWGSGRPGPAQIVGRAVP